MTPISCRRCQADLSAYVDSELAGHEMLAMRDHLGSCPDCTKEMEALKDVRSLLGSLSEPAPQAGLDDRLSKAVFAGQGAGASRHGLNLWSGGLVAAAAAVSAFAFMSLLPSQGSVSGAAPSAQGDPGRVVTVSTDAAFAEGGDPLGVYVSGLTVSSR